MEAMPRTFLKPVNHMQPIPSPGRTQGDGMENVEENSTENSVIKKCDSKSISVGYDNSNKQLGKQINLIPKQVTLVKTDNILKNLKTKEPKFVPYEPYKCAIKSIVPNDKKVKKKERKLSRKSNDSTCTTESSFPITELKTEETVLASDDWLNEKLALESEIKTLKEENGQLETQLKFQAQVNGELKTLLVAAVGEDIETRVHLLTEDKLQLAKALLNSSKRLTNHQEQTEWLAGQCEVWRSKFLASSLMVEELAKWKAALTQKTAELQETIKRLLEERTKARDSLLHTYRNLSVLRTNFDPAHFNDGVGRRQSRQLPSANILDLSAAIQKISTILQLHLLGTGMHYSKEPDLVGLEINTLAEKMAQNLLLNPSPLLDSDTVYNAVMGAAVAVTNHPRYAPACCQHCSGEIKQV